MIEIDFQDFTWYGSEATHQTQLGHMESYIVGGMHRDVANGNTIVGRHLGTVIARYRERENGTPQTAGLREKG